ncbi:MAG: hypothetical protein ACLUEW_11400 [Lachnospiraceae bacterium]
MRGGINRSILCKIGSFYDVPETDRCFVGLAYVDGIWHYYRNGGVDEKFGGLVEYNGAKYLVQTEKSIGITPDWCSIMVLGVSCKVVA